MHINKIRFPLDVLHSVHKISGAQEIPYKVPSLEVDKDVHSTVYSCYTVRDALDADHDRRS